MARPARQVDLAAPGVVSGPRTARPRAGAARAALGSPAWQRMARLAAGTGSALVVLSRERAAGAFADLALELHSTRAHFTGTPTWLEGLEIEARVVRHRTGPVERATSIRLRTRAA